MMIRKHIRLDTISSDECSGCRPKDDLGIARGSFIRTNNQFRSALLHF